MATATAIVLNYDGRGVVEEAVQSLLDQDQPGLEVLVVDNASRDGSDRDLEQRFGDRIRLLRAPVNLGYGAGNNLGIRASGAPHLILLNHDAVAAPGFVRALIRAAERDPAVGMVAARVRDYAARDRLDTTGHLMFWDGLNRGRGRGERDTGQYDACPEALFPSGAAALYRRAMLEEVGLFDERFFLYGDDAELGMRGRLLGWRCAYAPEAVAYHHYSLAAGKWSSLKAFHVERNRILLLLALFPLPLVLASPAFTAARLALQAWGALRGQGAAARLARERSFLHLVGITLRAWASAARLAPHALRVRRALRPRRQLGTAAFVRLVRAHRLPLAEVALKD